MRSDRLEGRLRSSHWKNSDRGLSTGRTSVVIAFPFSVGRAAAARPGGLPPPSRRRGGGGRVGGPPWADDLLPLGPDGLPIRLDEVAGRRSGRSGAWTPVTAGAAVAPAGLTSAEARRRLVRDGPN